MISQPEFLYRDDNGMTLKESLRIDASVQTFSVMRTGLYAGIVALFIVLAWRAELSLLFYVLILVVSAGVFGYLALAPPILLHMSQPPLAQRVHKNWQLLLRTGRGDVLWQGDLIKTHRYHLCVHFEFMVREPYRRSLYVTIFRDQVSAEMWRKLNVLANVMPTSTS